MTDTLKPDTMPPDTEPAPKPEPAPEDKAPEAPQTVFVRGGGTGTAASERLFEQRFQEAEERRDIAAAEKKLAAGQTKVDNPEGGAPVQLPGSMGGAVQYTSQLTPHPELPVGYILLEFLTNKGEKTGVQCLADLLVGADPEDPNNLCLVIVCPRCQQSSHKHMQDNQLRIFQSNKRFEYVKPTKPEFFQFEGNTYPSAGIILECPRFSCPDCNWRAIIERNQVRPA